MSETIERISSGRRGEMILSSDGGELSAKAYGDKVEISVAGDGHGQFNTIYLDQEQQRALYLLLGLTLGITTETPE